MQIINEPEDQSQNTNKEDNEEEEEEEEVSQIPKRQRIRGRDIDHSDDEDGDNNSASARMRRRERNGREQNEDDDGEDMFDGEEVERDYRQIPALDNYERRMLDNREYDDIATDAKRAAEADMRRRERRDMAQSGRGTR